MTQAIGSSTGSDRDASLREIAVSSLGHSRDYLGNLRKALQRVVDLLRGSRLDEGSELYAQSLDALNVIVFSLTAASAQLGPVAEPLARIQFECDGWLASLLDAQSHGDWTAIADCLEHEVGPELASWDDRIAATQGGLRS